MMNEAKRVRSKGSFVNMLIWECWILGFLGLIIAVLGSAGLLDWLVGFLNGG